MLQKNSYTALTYTMNNGDVGLVDGIVVETDSHSVVVADNNVRGPATPIRIGLAQILDIFE